MIDMTKILRDKKATAFFSFIIGLGVVVLLFHRPFGAIQYLSIPVSEIEGRVIRNGDRCFKYKSEDAKCS